MPRRSLSSKVMVVAVMLLSASIGRNVLAQVTIPLMSGNSPIGTQDPLVWVEGSADVRPGLQSSGLPLEHPFVVATPSYWGDVPGALWVSSSPSGTGAPFGYEYYIDFNLPTKFSAVMLNATWRGDDYAVLDINNVRLPGFGPFNPADPAATLQTDITQLVTPGTN